MGHPLEKTWPCQGLGVGQPQGWGWEHQGHFRRPGHTQGLSKGAVLSPGNWREQGILGDTWPHTGTLKGEGSMQKLGSHIP